MDFDLNQIPIEDLPNDPTPSTNVIDSNQYCVIDLNQSCFQEEDEEEEEEELQPQNI
ncbi:hypothetical protein MKX01_005046, partial [Papaver californicum]